MTGTDLIVAAPWIIFAAGLSVVCIRLLRARRAARPSQPSDDTQETQCPKKNAQAPWS